MNIMWTVLHFPFHSKWSMIDMIDERVEKSSVAGLGLTRCSLADMQLNLTSRIVGGHGGGCGGDEGGR